MNAIVIRKVVALTLYDLKLAFAGDGLDSSVLEQHAPHIGQRQTMFLELGMVTPVGSQGE